MGSEQHTEAEAKIVCSGFVKGLKSLCETVVYSLKMRNAFLVSSDKSPGSRRIWMRDLFISIYTTLYNFSKHMTRSSVFVVCAFGKAYAELDTKPILFQW